MVFWWLACVQRRLFQVAPLHFPFTFECRVRARCQNNRGSLYSLALIHRDNTSLWISLISATNTPQSLAGSPWGNQVELLCRKVERPNPPDPPAVLPLNVSLCREWIADCVRLVCRAVKTLRSVSSSALSKRDVSFKASINNGRLVLIIPFPLCFLCCPLIPTPNLRVSVNIQTKSYRQSHKHIVSYCFLYCCFFF